ncbi:hypothetical protein SAMN05421771_4089 [Granulicella pectinivorans]|uniref:Uncharacterized protein n=1 Tax=Granulicella pectinivorans TaxID=474950 RepID=A0A1I6MZR9_9BACT|nr:hypothetical protein SAMN05421771_4089 [Granulicella pectinivorans]
MDKWMDSVAMVWCLESPALRGAVIAQGPGLGHLAHLRNDQTVAKMGSGRFIFCQCK